MPKLARKSVFSSELSSDYKNNIIIVGGFIILLYLFNNLLYIYVPYIPNDPTGFFWGILKSMYNHVDIPFLTKDFIGCLWAINLCLLVGTLGYFSFLLIKQDWYRKIVKALISLLAILALFVIFRIFPFKLDSESFSAILKILLLILMAGLAVNIIRVYLKRT